ncbi:hypothetical protein HU200_043595 [Digitaria exilis]|uniref:Uncharacterized protein n=1 Tax=Digitaria exilis TaxID=1010633 RepID=A0A835BE14_9POAL|nr:hypothetical protein HU200_043595 [Digitaria exilis]
MEDYVISRYLDMGEELENAGALYQDIEAALERPGETLLSRLVGAFKPLYSLMRLASREIIIRIDCSEGEKEKGAAAPPPPKKMWRLPREEVHWILAQSNEPVCTRFRDLKRANPSLVPSPEEEKDPSTVLLYTCARIIYEEGEKFTKFQAWVRGEYASKGFVEVDYDYFGRRAEAIRRSNKARDEVFKDYDLS